MQLKTGKKYNPMFMLMLTLKSPKKDIRTKFLCFACLESGLGQNRKINCIFPESAIFLNEILIVLVMSLGKIKLFFDENLIKIWNVDDSKLK